MPFTLFVAPQIGNGVWEDPPWTNDSTGPFRSLLNKHIDVPSGEWFDEIDHPARRVSICLIEASTAVLDTIAAQPGVTEIIPTRANNRAQLQGILNALFSSYPVAWRNAAQAKLESWGVDTSWITGTHTMKDVLKYLMDMFSVAQKADGESNGDVLSFLMENLDNTVGSIPAQVRNAVGNWMDNKGIPTGWITGTTTIREVVHQLSINFPAIYGRIVQRFLGGEEF